jgi:hypothetical protein
MDGRTKGFRFSLRTMLLLVASIALLFAGVTNEIRRCRKEFDSEQCVIARVGDVGGRVEYLPWGDSWLSRFVPADSQLHSLLVSRVSTVYLSPVYPQVSVGDELVNQMEVFRDLGKLRHLRSVELRRAVIPTGAIQEIVKAPRLEQLRLGCVRVGESKRRLDDDDARHLGSAVQLRGLDLTCSAITERGLKALTTLVRLRELNLSGTSITDDMCGELNRLPNVRDLKLSATLITDAGVKRLASLQQLVVLDISSTEVTDRAGDDLVAMKILTHINVRDTVLSDAGYRRLRTEFPQAKIEWRARPPWFHRIVPCDTRSEIESEIR